MSAGANVCYAVLDRAVVDGRADEPVLPGTTHARLLEDVAALEGVLQHLGIGPGVTVAVDLPRDADHDVPAVTAALAVARLGGTVSGGDDQGARVLMVAAGSGLPAGGRPRLVLGGEVGEPDLDWRALMRAGRTDPAPSAVVPAEAAYSRTRRVGEQLEVLRGSAPPWQPAVLRDLLQV